MIFVVYVFCVMVWKYLIFDSVKFMCIIGSRLVSKWMFEWFSGCIW